MSCSPASSFGVHNSTVDNVCRAATERVLNEEVNGQWIPVRTPDFVTFENNLQVFADKLDALSSPTTPVPRETIVESYKGRKKITYQQASDSLSVSDVRPSDAYLKTFVKAEKIDFEKKLDPAPRVIQPRNPRYNLSLAVYLKPLEHVIYHAIDQLFGAKTVMKGLNAVEQGAAIREAWEAIVDPVGVDLDASRWDRHVSDVALHWEHDRYLAYFRGHHRDRLSQLLAWQYTNHCYAYLNDGYVKWSMRGRRASGDMNTAVGNVVLMTAMMWSWCRYAGIQNYRLINNGDDSVLIISRRDLHRMETIGTWFETMGFLMKVGEVVDRLERINFCQTQPVYDGERYIMCRDPRTVLAKDAHSLIPLDNETNVRGWLGSVGECGLALAGNLPVFNEYYSWMVKSGDKSSKVGAHPSMETGMAYLAHGLRPKYSEPTVEARVSFWRAWGMDGTDQRLLEQYYRKLPIQTCAPLHVPEGLRPEQTEYRLRGVSCATLPRV